MYTCNFLIVIIYIHTVNRYEKSRVNISRMLAKVRDVYAHMFRYICMCLD